MSSVKPNRMMDLTKTNYFANLKRKTQFTMDQKEQKEFNREVLNCISLLESRIKKLQGDLSTVLADQAKFNEGIVDGLSETFDSIFMQLKAVEECVGVEKVREFLDNFNKDQKIKPSETVKNDEKNSDFSTDREKKFPFEGTFSL